MATNFDLHRLGWHDFQSLCRTVAREILGQEVNAFADVHDGGRDGAFYGDWQSSSRPSPDRHFVIQAKHTKNANATLSVSMLTDEIGEAGALVDRGICDVYLLMTNARVTGRSHEQITQELLDVGVSEVQVFGQEWFNEIISENSRLRMLVPRLYGLGDLAQILDTRAYEQAQAVLESMTTDLAKLVRTSTFERAAEALNEHGLVLLTGAPMTGKTTIAAQLALGSADLHKTHVVKLMNASKIEERWNPLERQLFWLDDVFGDTHVRGDLVTNWQHYAPLVRSAIAKGSKFVLTSRDYIYEGSKKMLKATVLGALGDAEVVVDVAELTLPERKQVLYNHLQHGSQSRRFMEELLPHLDYYSEHLDFTPELARRISEPQFTRALGRVSKQSLDRFLEEPREMLVEVLSGLDEDSIAAIGLLFIEGNWVTSPVRLAGKSAELVERLGSDLAGVIAGLQNLEGSLVKAVRRGGEAGWTLAHPTMVDAFSDYIKNSEMLHLVIEKLTFRALLQRTVCGDLERAGSVLIPQSLWPIAMQRLHEVPQGLSRRELLDQRDRYLTHNCVAEFLNGYFEQYPEDLDVLSEPGLMLEAHAGNYLLLRLNELGLLPETIRARFAEHLIDYCVTGLDFGALTDPRFKAALTSTELSELKRKLEHEAFGEASSIVYDFTSSFGADEDREYFSEPLAEFADAVEAEFKDNERAMEFASRLRGLREEFIAEEPTPSLDEEDDSLVSVGSTAAGPMHGGRSIFDDLLDDRPRHG